MMIKDMSIMRKASCFISAIIIAISILLFALKSAYWYYPAVYGVWLFFDNLSFLRGNKTTLDLLIEKKYKKFIVLYLSLFVFGFLIEVFGRMILNLWTYPLVDPIILNTIGLIGYPFILMSYRETYVFLNSFLKNSLFSVLLSMLFGITIWEVLNVFSNNWIYKIPYVTFEIFHINIVVIVGWVILILGPIYIYGIQNRLKI